MKSEPLKNKLLCLKHQDESRIKNCKWIAYEIDIKSAVEWLKRELTNEEQPISEFMTQDIHNELCNLLNEAFEDVTDNSGDKKE